MVQKCQTLIFDGNNAIHRCRFNWGGGDALSMGEFQVVYNFFNLFNAAISDFSPKKVVFVLDGKPARRLAIDPEYKANRKQVDLTEEEAAYWESFGRQKKIISEMIEDLPVLKIYNPNEEADDVIYNYCRTNPNEDITVISNDSDYIQIVNKCKNTKVFNPLRRTYFEPTEYDYVAWKSMVGDSSDNIKGVKRVGKVTATKILKNGMLSERLKDESFRSQYTKAYSLISMFEDGVLENSIFTEGSYDRDSLEKRFEDFNFKSFSDGKLLDNLESILT